MNKRTKQKTEFKYKKLKKDLHWIDAVSKTGWCSLEDMENTLPANVVTGNMWIYKETDKYITLFGTYSMDRDGTIEFGDIITIPKKWI